MKLYHHSNQLFVSLSARDKMNLNGTSCPNWQLEFYDPRDDRETVVVLELEKDQLKAFAKKIMDALFDSEVLPELTDTDRTVMESLGPDLIDRLWFKALEKSKGA